jgi:chromodomain-helicase-DNA-binding protein 7
MITNYERISIFAQFESNLFIVDEADRLKNSNSKLQQMLTQLASQFKILLTGTSFQNTIEELQTLLELLHPGQFQDIVTAVSLNNIHTLQKKLKPHLLRRLKTDVDQSIASK